MTQAIALSRSARFRADLEVTDPGPTIDHVVVFDPRRSKYFRINRAAYAELSAGDVGDDVRGQAAAAGLLEGSLSAEDAAPSRRRSIGFWRVVDVDPSPVLDRLGPVVRVVAGVPGYIGGLVLIACGVAALFRPHPHTHLTPQLWIAVSIAMSATFVVHEFGHAAAVVRYGGRVRRVGIALMYLRPVCYCDASAAWEFPRRRQRVVVSFAGIFTNLTIAGASWSGLWLNPAPPIRHFLGVFGAANVVLGLLNLFPLIKLDGYWMLASVLDRPNLRKQSLAAAEGVLHRLLRLKQPRQRAAAWLVAFGAGSVLAPVVFVVLALDRMWIVSSRFGALGSLAWLAFAGYMAFQGARATVRYAKSLRVSATA